MTATFLSVHIPTSPPLPRSPPTRKSPSQQHSHAHFPTSPPHPTSLPARRPPFNDDKHIHAQLPPLTTSPQASHLQQQAHSCTRTHLPTPADQPSDFEVRHQDAVGRLNLRRWGRDRRARDGWGCAIRGRRCHRCWCKARGWGRCAVRRGRCPVRGWCCIRGLAGESWWRGGCECEGQLALCDRCAYFLHDQVHRVLDSVVAASHLGGVH